MSPVLRRVQRVRELNLFGVMFALAMVMWFLQPRFLDLGNLQDVVRDASILAVLAVGEATVLTTRNLDLSIGSVVGVTAYLATNTMRAYPDAGPLAALVIALGAGAAIGALNGVIVVLGRVPSIVATLGTLYIFRGLDDLPVLAGGGHEVSSFQMSPAYLDLSTAQLLGVPVMALMAIGVAGLFGFLMRESTIGRSMYATGSNLSAARLVGVPSGRLVFLAFVISGTVAGFGGYLNGARFGYVGPVTGQGLELQAIASAVIGGVAILGGRGSPLGAALGALLLAAIANALAVLNVPGVWLQAFTGMFILAAIALQSALGTGGGVRRQPLARRKEGGTSS